MSTWELESEIESYYERGGERERLTRNARGRLEFARMQDLLRRVLPGEGLDVLDVGGATGIHSKWLAEDGHRVTSSTRLRARSRWRRSCPASAPSWATRENCLARTRVSTRCC